ncbi:MAG: AAA family ATPase [Brumimicrobium sp.]|nr:AAA family ATPase [Brumimicrobium sp.]
MNLSDLLKEETLTNFPFPPSEEQENLLLRLCNFYTSPTERSIFLLKGYAGTGKTTLMSAFVRALYSLKRKTVLLAPTGRAAKVFSQRSFRSALTIHKKIYRKETLAGGSVRLGLAPNLHTNTLFIVDEASMIGDYTRDNEGNISHRNLLEDLINYVFSGKNCKLIFMGDEAQLPPVGADFSPAINPDYLKNHYPGLSITYYGLTHVLRQAVDSDILANATALRSAPDNSYPLFFKSARSDLFRLPGAELEDVLDTSFSNYGNSGTIVITRSNKRANLFNQQIRSRIFWFEEQIVANDLLMVVRNNYFWLDESSPAGFIANGETLEVQRVHGSESLYGFDFMDVTVKMIDFPEIEAFKVKLMLNVLDEEGPNLPRNRLKELFYEIEKDYAFEKNKKKRYEKIMNDPYFSALQVKYAYAVTCHKSQGGQWPCVFVDQGYLTEETLDRSYFRWLYTAFTRATEKLYLINFNDQFFDESWH